MHLKKHIVPYVLTPLLVLFIGASYMRFLVQHDHLISYEGYCDPESESCFVYCEDEGLEDLTSCPEDLTWYYTEVERYAANLVELCGDTIDGCETADYCMENEKDCSVTYCDPEINEGLCDVLGPESQPHKALSDPYNL